MTTNNNTPSIYIDTNVFRDCVKARKKESIHILLAIRDKKWNCVTSIFTLMEFTEIEKDSIFLLKKINDGEDVNKILRMKNQKDLTLDELKQTEKKVKGFLEEYNFVKFMPLKDNDAWNWALKCCSTSNLSVTDIIHLATAWQSKCSIIITSDEFFITEGTKIIKQENASDKLRICKPTDLLEELK